MGSLEITVLACSPLFEVGCGGLNDFVERNGLSDTQKENLAQRCLEHNQSRSLVGSLAECVIVSSGTTMVDSVRPTDA